jgi:enterobactin synthetase component D
MENPDILTTPYYFSMACDSPSDATPKRITEFRAGRFCAEKAIRAFNPHWTGEVGMDPDGAPRWPEGLVGSITHTQGFAAAAVAPSNICFSIGIDSEAMAEADILKAAKQIVITEKERQLSGRLALSEDSFILLVFSAKESVYKCLYPLTKRPLKFSNVILDDIDLQHRTFDFHLSESVAPEALLSSSSRGRFEFTRGCVHAGVELRAPRRD